MPTQEEIDAAIRNLGGGQNVNGMAAGGPPLDASLGGAPQMQATGGLDFAGAMGVPGGMATLRELAPQIGGNAASFASGGLVSPEVAQRAVESLTPKALPTLKEAAQGFIDLSGGRTVGDPHDTSVTGHWARTLNPEVAQDGGSAPVERDGAYVPAGGEAQQNAERRARLGAMGSWMDQPPGGAPAGGGGGMPGEKYPGAEGRYMGSFYQQGHNAREIARAEQNQNTVMADRQDQYAAEAEQRMVDRNAERAHRDGIIDSEMAKAKQLTEAARGQQYDQGRVFRNPGGVMMAMGAAISKDGGDIMNAALDRDFKSWQANAAQKKGDASDQWNLVSQFRSAYHDRETADLAAEAAHKTIAADRLSSLVKRSGNPVIEARGQAAVTDLLQKRDQLMDQANKRIQAAAAASAASERARQEKARQQAFENGLKLEELDIKRAEAEGKVGKRGAEEQKQLTDETKYVATEMQKANIPETRAAVERARESMKGATALNTNPISNALAEAHPWIYDKVSGGGDWQQAYATVKNAIMKKQSGGAISEGEGKRLTQQLDNAGNIEARRRALANVSESLDAAESTIKAGVTDQATETFDTRRAARGPNPRAGLPASFRSGTK